MKIEKFLIWIQDKLMNYPDISLITLQMFINKFYECLSEKEQIKWKLQVQMIKELSLKQISLDTFVSYSIIDKLENDLNDLKENDKNES